MTWLSEELEPAHTCHANQCRTPVRPEYLMCGRHWAMVPPYIRRGVWKNYRPGQCEDKNPSVTWMNFANAAIGWVAMQEGKPMTKQQTLTIELIHLL